MAITSRAKQAKRLPGLKMYDKTQAKRAPWHILVEKTQGKREGNTTGHERARAKR